MFIISNFGLEIILTCFWNQVLVDAGIQGVVANYSQLTNPSRPIASNSVFNTPSRREAENYSLTHSGNSQAAESLIDYGEVYYDRVHKNRSLCIVNNSSRSLTFLLGAELEQADMCEIWFSTEQTARRLERAFVVEAFKKVDCPKEEDVLSLCPTCQFGLNRYLIHNNSTFIFPLNLISCL